MTETAYCRRCEQTLSVEAFGTYHTKRDDRDHRTTYCRECERERSREKRRGGGRVSRADFLAKCNPRNRMPGMVHVPLTVDLPAHRLAAAMAAVSDEPRPLTIRERLERARRNAAQRQEREA